MEQLGEVILDWVNGRVRFGRSWTTVHKTLSGATPLARARVAKQDEPEVATISAGIDTMICTKLSPEEKETLEQLTRDFRHVFALHPKRPGRCHSLIRNGIRSSTWRPTQAQQGWQPSCHSWTRTPVSCDLSNSFRLRSVLVRRTTRRDSWRPGHWLQRLANGQCTLKAPRA